MPPHLTITTTHHRTHHHSPPPLTRAHELNPPLLPPINHNSFLNPLNDNSISSFSNPLSKFDSWCLSTLHFLKVPENSFEVLKLPKNSFEVLKLPKNNVEVLKILENKLESMKILENKLESLKLQDN
ncbi:hypothetical protein Tco_1171790 [Tanacetum coccineum]